MPSTYTYPGVYIEELSSGVRTISGVATSIAAFVGWAPQGPTNKAVRILSFSDYERMFGEIHPNSYLGYSVKHFFDNGGSDAYVLRIADTQDPSGKCSAGGQEFEAVSPGKWSDFYGVAVKSREVPGSDNRFTVTLVRFQRKADGTPASTEDDQKANPPEVVEVFSNLSANANDARYAVDIINDSQRGSMYVKVLTSGDSSDTTASLPFSGGDDTVPATLDDINNNPWDGLVETACQEDGPLDQIDLFNLLCVPGLTKADKLDGLTMFCNRRRAFLIADCEQNASVGTLQTGGSGVSGIRKNGAFYFPWLNAPDPLAQGSITDFPPCGFVAGLYARTDASRGVWKAPAGTEATIIGTVGPKVPMTDKQNGTLNTKGINCIRTFPVYGTINWGARTLDGDDEIGSEWKYVPVRRTALFIEETLYRATKWAIFEPNDEPLWSQLRLNIGSFMHDLFRQGAFQGRSPREAYFVKCDKESTTPSDINRGIVNVVVGFAPLKPAEFVVIKLTQIAGQLEA